MTLARGNSGKGHFVLSYTIYNIDKSLTKCYNISSICNMKGVSYGHLKKAIWKVKKEGSKEK